MKKYPEKFVYIFLEDMETNPKLIFQFHESHFPKDSRPYATRSIDNLEKEDVLTDIDAIDKIGFFAVLTVLLDSRIKKGHHDAAVLYLESNANGLSIDLNIHEKSPLKGQGKYYDFVPLKPFYPEYNMSENIHDQVLSMRAGRLIVQALLD